MGKSSAVHLGGLIFDLDGTLTDSWPPALAAFRAAIEAQAHRPYSDEELRSYAGPAEEGILQRLFPDHWQTCYARYLEEFDNRIDGASLLFPGMGEALTQLRAKGVRLAIVSGKTKPAVESVLRETRLTTCFDQIIGGWPGGVRKVEDIAAVRSHWALSSQQVAYIGDTVGDIQAAKKANVMSLGASWAPGTDPEALEAATPDRLFETTQDFRAWCAQMLDFTTI